MKRIFWIAALLFFFLAPCLPARAESPPMPGRKADIEALTNELGQARKTQDSLKKKLSGIGKELDRTRAALIDLAGEIKDNEKKRAALEEKIALLKEEELALTGKLESQYGHMADIALALTRIGRTPPAGFIANPDSPLRAAQSAMLLKEVLPAVDRQAESLSVVLDRLHEIAIALEKDRAESLAVKADLEKKLASMNDLVQKRESLYGLAENDYEQNKARVARLSEEAANLRDLLSRLEKDKTARKTGKAAASFYGGKIPRSGKARMPAEGAVVEAFGEETAIGAKSQGVLIETAPGAIVVAPMGGVVRFSGVFKNYGNMVIIEHDGGYHSLIAGLGKITASPDNPVKSGEPVGELPETSSRGGKPALYYELRYKGDPVNPVSVFPGIKS